MKGCTCTWGPFMVSHISAPKFLGIAESNQEEEEQKEVSTFLSLRPFIQVSIHTVASASFMNELKIIFPSYTWRKDETLIISTMQPSSKELVEFDVEVDAEKDRLLENFVNFANRFCDLCQSQGIFADFFDPCSGLPARTKDSNVVFSEVQAAQTLHQYQIMNAGCCKILLHPEWGSAVYPASIVVQSTADVIIQLMQQHTQWTIPQVKKQECSIK